MYLGENGKVVRVYALSTAWDVTSASDTATSLSTPEALPVGMDISPTGIKLYAVDDGRKVYQYS